MRIFQTETFTGVKKVRILLETIFDVCGSKSIHIDIKNDDPTGLPRETVIELALPSKDTPFMP